MRLLTRFRPTQQQTVTLYSRPGCHLCEDARQLLVHLSPKFRIEINEVDITSDPDLVRRYDIRIPVMVFPNGRELEAPIRESDVRRELRRR